MKFGADYIFALKDLLVLNYGYNKNSLKKMIKFIPDELLHPDHLNLLKQSLAGFVAFCNKHVIDEIEVLEVIPSVLMFDSDLLEQRFSDLSEYFGQSKDVDKLIKNVPEILLLHDNDVKSRLDFFIREMRVHPNTLANSMAVAYDLQEVKIRYEFLLRAGLYRHPSPKDIGTRAEAYPLVGEIVETSVKEFITNVVGNGITMEEFELFSKMRAAEFDDKEEAEWFLENGYEDPDIVDEIAQRRLDAYGYTNQPKKRILERHHRKLL